MNGEVRMEMELIGSIDPTWETSDAISIEAVPPVNMVIKPCVVGLEPVANILVNSIPYVMNSAPGIVVATDMAPFSMGNDVRLLLK